MNSHNLPPYTAYLDHEASTATEAAYYCRLPTTAQHSAQLVTGHCTLGGTVLMDTLRLAVPATTTDCWLGEAQDPTVYWQPLAGIPVTPEAYQAFASAVAADQAHTQAHRNQFYTTNRNW